MRHPAVLLLAVLAACGGDSATTAPAVTSSSSSSTTSSSTTVAPAPSSSSSVITVPRTTTTSPRRPPSEVIEVAYGIDVRTTDPVGADFAAIVESTLTDTRGWERARFELVRRDSAEYRVILAEPADAHELCKPYDVYMKYSCQNGPLVVINAERWREATPQWTGDLATYRQMLVNHEFGHLLGQHHPKNHCPVRGRPAALMSQQSTELNGCLPNPWPLDYEVEAAARHDEPLAPPYSR